MEKFPSELKQQAYTHTLKQTYTNTSKGKKAKYLADSDKIIESSENFKFSVNFLFFTKFLLSYSDYLLACLLLF